MEFPFPKRIQDLPPPEQAKAKARFLIRLAALYYDDTGSCRRLSTVLGMNEKSLAQSPNIQPPLAIALETLIKDPNITRQTFRPDIFIAA